MTDKENACLKEKYTKFRFEDSLRKYEPPPRKRVKIDSSTIGINAAETNINSRLIRLCETRKLYHATSRERASEFSKKKEGHQESTKKNEEIISDFDERGIEMKMCLSGEKESKESNIKEYMQLKSFGVEELREEVGEFTPPKLLSLSLKESYERSEDSELKESINQENQSISPISSSSFMSKRSMMSENSEREASNLSKESKVKDIEFHIALVEEIHLKIVEEYKKLEILEGQYECKYDDEVDMFTAQESKPIPISSENYQNHQELLKNYHPPIAEQTNNHHIELSISEEQSPSNINLLIHFHKENVNISKTPTGRFHIQSSKGACLFSARIFSRLCEKKSPNRITNQILKHHPYLSESKNMLEMMANNYKE